MDNFKITEDQRNEINIMACRVKDIGAFIRQYEPGEYPNTGDGFCYDIGSIIEDTGWKISKMMGAIESAAFDERKAKSE